MSAQINVSDYTYDLPEERIAKFPLDDRASSKLLVYQRGVIEHKGFKDIVDLLPAEASLYFNNTRVIPARLAFQKATGALIEIFLLQPQLPSPVIALAMEAHGPVQWKCMIGNAKRWKDGQLSRETVVDGKPVTVSVEKTGNDSVSISWNDASMRFVDVVDALGKTPLPPYLRREPVAADKMTYQTVYSEKEGAVAAPTAGLHFTDEIIDQLKAKSIRTNFLTLHVSAGTFQPIKTATAQEHQMHAEQMLIRRENLEQLMQPGRFTVAVGTTSMRTLESTYWYGVKLLQQPDADFHIPKLYPYNQPSPLPRAAESFGAVLARMDALGVDELTGTTEIFIFPGYEFKVVQGLITNFHQPNSTLILLVAAFIGADWRKVYREALDNNYRFLSYGDSSLLIPRN